jgi:hypothetical protein
MVDVSMWRVVIGGEFGPELVGVEHEVTHLSFEDRRPQNYK